MQLHIGIAGEVRCVITGVDGEVKTDTGYQKNIILNQGLDFFGGEHGNEINDSCAIGGGTTTPTVTQTKLDAFIALAVGTNITSDYSYVDEGDGLYRMWEQKKYRFTTSVAINISELGLVSEGTTSANYYLTTRVLTKDSLGAPTSFSLKAGETLDVYYKIHKVIDISDKAFTINVLDGIGGAVPYNVVIRPAYVSSAAYNEVSSDFLQSGLSRTYFDTTDLEAITSEPASSYYTDTGLINGVYSTGSYKAGITIKLSLNELNIAIRRLTVQKGICSFQMRIGRASDDAPLTKSNKDTLEIPLEISWGRFEGVL